MDAQSLFRRVSNIHLVLYSPLQRGGAMAPCEVLNACLKIHAENDVGWNGALAHDPIYERV